MSADYERKFRKKISMVNMCAIESTNTINQIKNGQVFSLAIKNPCNTLMSHTGLHAFQIQLRLLTSVSCYGRARKAMMITSWSGF